jgi:hypothetical protein
MQEIVEDVKDIIAHKQYKKGMKNKKIKDADVAQELGVSTNILAIAKARGKILYDEIMEYCGKESICINTLLFNQSPDSLQGTDKLLAFKCLMY